MFILFFLAWIIFNGKITTEIIVFGLIISAIMYVFMCKVLDFSFKKDIFCFKKIPKILKLIGVLLIEIVKANIQTMGWIMKPPADMKPVVVDFTVDFKNKVSYVLLADMITLTPGTITGELKGNHYTVHALDETMSEGLDSSSFVDVIREMENFCLKEEVNNDNVRKH